MKLLLPIDEILDEWLEKNYRVAASWSGLRLIDNRDEYEVEVTLDSLDDIWPLDSELDDLIFTYRCFEDEDDS